MPTKQEQYLLDVAAEMRRRANETALNNAWAAANPGQASPNGTVVSPGTPVTSIDQLPAGSVDPAIPYQIGAAQRGAGYAQQDYDNMYGPDGTATRDYNNAVGRTNTQFGWQQADATQGRDRTLADLLTGKDRSLADLLTGRDRNLGDLTTGYDRNTADLTQQYQRLGRSQLQAINQAGALQGGALAQALAKRTANQAQTQGRMTEDYNTSTGRVNQDYGTQTGRVNEDYNTQTGRVNQDYNTAYGDGGRAYTQRGWSLSDLLNSFNDAKTNAGTALGRQYGELAPYTATLTTQGIQGAMPALAGDPGYEVINGTLYQRQPGGGVAPVGPTTSAPAASSRPVSTPAPNLYAGAAGALTSPFNGSQPPIVTSGNPYARTPVLPNKTPATFSSSNARRFSPSWAYF